MSRVVNLKNDQLRRLTEPKLTESKLNEI